MKIVIDLPEERYKWILSHKGVTDFATTEMLYGRVRNGTVLPKNSRLIDANLLIEQYHLDTATKYGNKDADQQNHSYSTMMMYEIADMIDDAPTVVGQSYGEWVYDSYGVPHCSECGYEVGEVTPYCPSCGAKMEDDDGDSD